MARPHTIRRARADELEWLQEIEDLAGEAYATVGIPGDLEGLPLAEIAAAHDRGLLWVATDTADRAIAFALCWARSGAMHLREIDVHPDFSRRGIGRRLIEFLVDECRRGGLSRLTLTTFADVPWNAPLYRRYGFRDLAETEWPDWIRDIRADEATLGLDRWERVAMVRDIDLRAPIPSRSATPAAVPSHLGRAARYADERARDGSRHGAMYTANEDRVVEIATAPRPDVGAPLPTVVSDERHILLAYIVSEPDPNWDGTYVNVVGPASDDEPIAIVRFRRPYAHLFGPPNDEAFSGHPLASRGLKPYSVSAIERSSWLHSLERMNSVHPSHRPEHFSKYNHYVFAFHDSTFECIAEGFSFELHRGSMRSAVRLMATKLGSDAE